MLAFLSKQNTASLPGVILLAEYLVIDRTWEGWKRKIPWFCLTFALWAIFVLYVVGFFSGGIEGRGLLEDVSVLMQETEHVSRWSYLCTQFNVLVIYLRLLFLPIGQGLDYLYRFNNTFFDGYTRLASAFLIGIIVIGIWSIKKRPVIAFGIFWFFITLLVESSIMPIKDALVEHRLYLPMFGFALTISYLVFYFLSKRIYWAIVASVIIVLCLGTATYLRNRVWQDNITLWSDVVFESPRNARGHYNLGIAFAKVGNFEDAIRHYLEALKLKPERPNIHNSLGNALLRQGRIDAAIKHCSEALRLNPDFVDAHINLGDALVRQGRVKDAIHHYLDALRIVPESTKANYSIASALARQGHLQEAAKHYLEVIRIKPDSAAAHNGLGITLARQGKIDQAIGHFKKAQRLNPEDVRTRQNLDRALRLSIDSSRAKNGSKN